MVVQCDAHLSIQLQVKPVRFVMPQSCYMGWRAL